MPKTYMALFIKWASTTGEFGAGKRPAWQVPNDEAEDMSVADLYAGMLSLSPERMRPLWHLRWASWLRERFHGPLSLALLSAPNLQAGLETAVRYFPERLPYLEFALRTTGDGVGISVMPLWAPEALRHAIAEAPLYLIHDYASSFTSFDTGQVRVRLERPDSGLGQAFSNAFKCPVEFAAERNEFVLPVDWLAIENPEFDEDAWRAAISRCDASGTKRAPPATVVEHVRTRLEHGVLEEGVLPRLSDLALELSLSTRSVIRHLDREGTSYHQLLDGLRRQRAKTLLSNAAVRVSDVAAALGYEDPANFGRAFRRWFGTSPGRYRSERQ